MFNHPSVLTSPWFGLFLVAAGVAYIILVDETKRPTTQYFIWPVLGWSAVGMLVLAIFYGWTVRFCNRLDFSASDRLNMLESFTDSHLSLDNVITLDNKGGGRATGVTTPDIPH
jgi:hypothetical protein